MAVNREKLQREMEQSKSERGGSGVNFVGEGTVVLRVLEFTDDEGDQQFARKVVKWGSNVGTKRKDLCVHRSATFGEDVPDAVEEYGSLVAERGQESPYTARKQYYVNAIDVNQKSLKVEMWGLPTSVWEAISVVVCNDQWADVLEPETGHAFVIKGSGKGLDRTYAVTVDRNPYPVSDELMQQVVDPLTKVKDVGLEGQCRLLGVELTDLWPDGGASLENVESMTGDVEGQQEQTQTSSVPSRQAPAASGNGGVPARGAQEAPSRPSSGPPAPRPLPTPSRTAPVAPVASGNKQAASGGLIRGLTRGGRQ